MGVCSNKSEALNYKEEVYFDNSRIAHSLIIRY